jgi:hypothetical protein
MLAFTGMFRKTIVVTITMLLVILLLMLVVWILEVLSKLPRLWIGFIGVVCGGMNSILLVIRGRVVLLV